MFALQEIAVDLLSATSKRKSVRQVTQGQGREYDIILFIAGSFIWVIFSL